jgi:DNA-binding FrmR family transcriptional regulator
MTLKKGESEMQTSSLTVEMRKDIVSRLKKIEGQARGIRGMIEKDGNCTDILIQISALSSAARKLGTVIMEGCLNDCASSIQNMNIEKDVKVKIDDMAKAIHRFINMK